MNSADVRRTFLDFYEQRGHTVVPSAPLVPANDPTLLFTNAGMVPFKDVFLGTEQRSYARAASCQKCLRVSGKHNDLEEIGPSPQHQTFFEMLGKFSFGDYFKDEALAFTWEFLTKTVALPGERLHPTVFEEDDESAAIWAKLTGRPESAIVRLGADENFWSMGETGPCGPNSEVMFDRTGKCLRDGSDCDLTCGCDRWWELGNDVFMQYDRAADGTLNPLPKPGVDFGMGLERLTTVLQDVNSNYQIDTFAPLFEAITALTGIRYDQATTEQQTALRILVDHSRAVTFLISDGVRPSNEGRGYVLRRLLRRAIYYARTRLIWNKDYMETLASTVGGTMSDAYPELHQNAHAIMEIVREEEEKFNETLGRGRSTVVALGELGRAVSRYLGSLSESQQARFNEASARTPLTRVYSSTELPEPAKLRFLKPYQEIVGDEPWNASPEVLRRAASRTPTLNGETAFLLWDTYGIPPELAAEVAQDQGLAVDTSGFERALEEQRERGRADRAADRASDEALIAAIGDTPATAFAGYESLASDAKLLALLRDGKRVDSADEGEEVDVVLDSTTFYAEGGGQVGDRGSVVGPQGEVAVESVRRVGANVFVHSGRVALGRIAEGDAVRAEVDEQARRATMRNHTATHLLHKALRVVLGPQAKQAGSLVAPDRLRFDFLHSKPLTDDELREAERIVQEQVMGNRPVSTDVMPVQQALDSGADAMFDEKYGEEARVVTVNGTDAFSRELCGGTHCHATGEIGAFFIVDQRSVGAGVRRVDAVTGERAYAWMDERRRVADTLAREYNVPLAELPERLREVQERAKAQPKATAALPDPADVIDRAEQRDGALLIVDRIEAGDAESLREFGDELRRRAKSAAVVLGAVFEEKPSVLIMLTPDQVESGLHAGKLAKEVGKRMGAGGGGRPDVATAGGKSADALDDGLACARELILGAG